MSTNDDSLADEPFTYRLNKDGKVFIAWRGKTIMILKAQVAQRFLRQVTGATPDQAQLAMAKITGNFKHGNERQAKTHNDHQQ